MNKNIIFLIVFFTILLTPFIAKGAVVINEIAWMGTENSSSDEWIELYSDQQTDLAGWVLEAVDGTPIINLEGTISANGYFLLERTNDDSVPNIIADQIYTGALGNSGEYLKLIDGSNNIIDEVNCSDGWPAGDNSTKQTMQLVNSEWETSDSTPKAENATSSEEPEDTPEEPTPSTPIDVKNQSPIADAGDNIIAFIDEEINFDGSKSYDPDGKELSYSWNLGDGGLIEDITATYKYSFPGTYLVTLMVYDGFHYSKDTITVEIYPKKITINEFLPNPIGKDQDGEWIEIYNDSDQVIDISGWQLDDEDGGSKPFTFPENTLIAPKSYLVFSRQVTGISLNNDTDKVRLLLSTGVVFQEISYEKAKEGQSSARISEDFVWSMPTPGLSNIAGIEEQVFSYNHDGPLQSKTTNQPTETIALQYKESPEIEGGWTQLSQSNTTKTDQQQQQQYYNLANLEKSTQGNNGSGLIILLITLSALAVGIGIINIKKKP